MEMTLRKANADRKLCDKKINDLVQQITTRSNRNKKSLLGFYQTVNPIIGTFTPKEYEQDIVATWQKLNDLIVRRCQLNDAVMTANGGTNMETATLVEVAPIRSLIKATGTEKLTIAQAIARKGYVKNTLMPLLMTLNRHVTERVEAYNQTKEQLAAEHINQVNRQFGPESTAAAKGRIEYSDETAKNYELTLVDPINAVKKMEEAKEFLEDYLNNIDSIISNATETTMVEVAD